MMSELERLDEALAWVHEVRVTARPESLGPHTKEQMRLVEDAARAYRGLLANGQRVEPDYEAALDSLRTMFYPNKYSDGYALEAVTQAVDAAIAGLSVYPKEAENG